MNNNIKHLPPYIQGYITGLRDAQGILSFLATKQIPAEVGMNPDDKLTAKEAFEVFQKQLTYIAECVGVKAQEAQRVAENTISHGTPAGQA